MSKSWKKFLRLTDIFLTHNILNALNFQTFISPFFWFVEQLCERVLQVLLVYISNNHIQTDFLNIILKVKTFFDNWFLPVSILYV